MNVDKSLPFTESVCVNWEHVFILIPKLLFLFDWLVIEWCVDWLQAKHKIEGERARAEIEIVKKGKEEEMEEVHKR